MSEFKFVKLHSQVTDLKIKLVKQESRLQAELAIANKEVETLKGQAAEPMGKLEFLEKRMEELEVKAAE